MAFFIDRFIAVAEAAPRRVAIRDCGQDVTYGALLEKAAAIGAHLATRGIGREDVIGLCFEKSADYIAALLGAWHAGAAIAPLPPSLPAARREYIVKDAHIRHFLSPQDIAGLPPPGRIAPQPVAEDTLAYVMHTSGSTGASKGVMVEHRGILNVLDAQIAAFGMTPENRSLFYLSISFDASLSDIGTALLSGATLVIADDETLRDGAALTRLLQAERITHADLPPALLRALRPGDMPDSLSTIIIGGEACPPETVRAWAKTRTVINVYGPTETTICTSLCRCNAGDWTLPLLGAPFPGVDYFVFEDELYIGGLQLARGYLNLPALTEQKFVTLGGRRLYRTGDRVRRLENGGIEFLGRMDRQFKLRGQLVEPDEVEACLHAHPAVRHAAVLKASERLIAYIVRAEPQAAGAEDLRRHAQKTLPRWMVPETIVFLGALPKTPTGKTDYAALAARPLPQAMQIAPPETEGEKTLWRLWRDILGHEHFGLEHGFYAAGGDSLGVIRLLLDADRAGLRLSPADIAAGRTLRDLAKGMARENSTARAAGWLKQNVAFDAAWQELFRSARLRPDAPPPPGILLTGATGFLGGRVLAGLLQSTTAEIWCPVRAATAEEAQDRIRKTFGLYRIPVPADWSRIRAFPADLAKARFGLDAEAYERLAACIGAIYHCAATVNMVADYNALRPANVEAVRHVLRFALTGARKHLHCASTLSVFVGSDKNAGRLMESDRLAGVQTVYGGYAQTKFAAEWMLLQVPEDVLPAHHYRFGLLTGDTRTGRGAARDFLALFAEGIARLGYIPEGFDEKLHVDITPVDHAATAMLRLSHAAPPGIYHIANPRSLSLGDVVAGLRRAGRRIRPLPLARWREMTAQRPLDMAETAAVLGLCRCLPPEDYAGQRTMDLFQATETVFDMTEADKYLRPAGMTCPAPDAPLVDLYIRQMNIAPPFLRICFFGPESTGKSTLAQRIAAHYGAALVAEYAKTLIERQNGDITASDMPRIAAGQLQAMQAAAPAAQDAGMMVCDTDALTTTIWSRWLFGGCPGWIDDLAAAQDFDLTFLMDIDTEWVDDIHRYLPDDRANFLAACKEALEKQDRRYILLSGSWGEKFAAARAAIDALRAQAAQARKTGT